MLTTMYRTIYQATINAFLIRTGPKQRCLLIAMSLTEIAQAKIMATQCFSPLTIISSLIVLRQSSSPMFRHQDRAITDLLLRRKRAILDKGLFYFFFTILQPVKQFYEANKPKIELSHRGIFILWNREKFGFIIL